MSRPLIVKTGTTIPALRARRGDYEQWIARGLGRATSAVDVVDPSAGDALPAASAPSGVIVTGSSSMVSAREPWSERIGAWLADAVAADTPVLGICYGHQLLAQALGGAVAPNPAGREIGTVDLRLLPAASSDPLLGGLASPLPVHTTHVESVASLPPGATRLAESDLDPNQAFSVGDAAWGVQFHPEFDAEVMRGYLAARREILRSEGLDPDALLAAVRDAPVGPTLLRRFAARLR